MLKVNVVMQQHHHIDFLHALIFRNRQLKLLGLPDPNEGTIILSNTRNYSPVDSVAS